MLRKVIFVNAYVYLFNGMLSILSALSTNQTTLAISYNLLFSIWYNYYGLTDI